MQWITHIKCRLDCVKITFCLNHLDPNLTSLYLEEVLLGQPAKLKSHCPREGGLLCTTGNKEVKFLALEWKIQAQTKRQALWFNEVSFSFLFSPNTHTYTPKTTKILQRGKGRDCEVAPKSAGRTQCLELCLIRAISDPRETIHLFGCEQRTWPPWGATSVILEDEVREDHPTPSVSQPVNDDKLAGVMLFWAPKLC